jgi:hypothetical protein
MAAVSSDDGARRFYILSALYGSAALYSILQFPEVDPATVLLYFLCILHVQVSAPAMH